MTNIPLAIKQVNDTLDDNLEFLGRVRLEPHLVRILQTLYQEQLHMADIDTDITRAENDLDAETQEVSQLKGNVAAVAQAQQAQGKTITDQAQTIADLRQQVADLKAANPGIDTTALEAKLTQAEQNNSDLADQNKTLAGLIPPAPPAQDPQTQADPKTQTDPQSAVAAQQQDGGG